MRPTDEQEELRAAVRQLLARQPGPDAWGPLTGQIGAAGLAVPEEHGGAGCGPLEVHVVMEELGRALSPVPYLGSAVLTTQALLACGGTAPLRALAEGSAVGALAWAENGSWEPSAVRAAARRAPDGDWRLTGVKDHVLDGADADLLVVAARTDTGISLFQVPVDGPGVRRERLVPMDATRPQARVVLDGAAGRLLGADGDGGRALAQVRDLGCLALAAEQVGAAGRCLELTVAYARERVQFGRPIGSFQAVKHRLADAYVQVEAARSIALGAAHTAAAGAPDLPRFAAAAKSACSEAFSAVAGETIQLHGGIGVTWEHDAHRYFKRAHGSAQLLGTPAEHRRRLAGELELMSRHVG
ncbi:MULTISPECIES: acyl-CoA dehydrogenase family protein [unclassified Streptomyces]|uniref:acyl-CoA dehydrogenase family protein n=1 Tax=unclassified Streptomyces TaxID=2593676 RepID=UPI00036F92E4|nr:MULTISPECIES: acyl-CoA dehydrogenase family protein [unclassified Streptomyces]MYT27728.1 acyl-CoA dehydrogenase [Streptomyces sp. SID8354]